MSEKSASRSCDRGLGVARQRNNRRQNCDKRGVGRQAHYWTLCDARCANTLNQILDGNAGGVGTLLLPAGAISFEQPRKMSVERCPVLEWC